MIFPNNPKAEEVAQEVVEKYLLKAPGNTKVLEEEIAKAISSQVAKERADIFRKIEFCGFGAMEWRQKLLEKLRGSEHE